MKYDFDVVIAGCGPTGGTLANLLAREGLEVLVVEREAGVFDKPRAIGLDHEALRILQFCGIAHQLFPHVRPYQGSEWRGVDNQIIRAFAPTPPPYPMAWPSNVTFLQPQFDRMLRDKLQSRHNATVLCMTEVTQLSQDADSVCVTLASKADGSSKQVRAKYLVGCDGANSVVRGQLGIALEDLGLDEWWVVIDALRTGDMDYGTRNVQYADPSRPGTYVVGPGNLRRWEFRILPHESPDEFKDPARVLELLSTKVDTSGLELWRSAVYRFQARVAQSWGQGRVFLAGDAAHQTPPHLGQGMVSGLRDASNLAWKLLQLDAGAPATLMATYLEERRPHFRALVETAKQFGEVIGLLDIEAARARDRELAAKLQSRTRDETRQDHVPPLRNGLIDKDAHGQPLGVAGQLAVQPQVSTQDGARLLDDLLDPRFQILVAADAAQEMLQGDDLEFWNSIDGDVIAIDAPGTERATQPAPGSVQFLLETDGRFHDWLRRNECRAVIVRPDRYVYGATGSANELHRMISDLRRALRPQQQMALQ